MNVLLTGATGFIGKSLAVELLDRGFNLSVVLRRKVDFLPKNIKQFVVQDFSNHPDFSRSLKTVDCVIHLAGMAHIIDKSKVPTLDDFRKINTDLTQNLAKQAADAGVSRFVFLSSIGVNGNQNQQPFTEKDIPTPQEPYAVSKYEAEQGLLQLAKTTPLEVVIIRPPLVYAIDAPGNFGRLIRWANVKKPLPLPLGAVFNKRSLLALDNLVDFIGLCIFHPKAANQIFLISDDEVLSTTQLLQKIAKAFGKKPLLLPIPVGFMIFIARFFGKKADAIRLFSSLRIDNSKAKDLLAWKPITIIDKQLKKNHYSD